MAETADEESAEEARSSKTVRLGEELLRLSNAIGCDECANSMCKQNSATNLK